MNKVVAGVKGKHGYKVKPIVLMCMMLGNMPLWAAEPLDKTIPKKTYDIPAGDLSDTLPSYAAESGILLGFDPALTKGKRSHSLRGQFSTNEGFANLLRDSGLEAVQDEQGRYQLKKADPEADKLPGQQSFINFNVDAVEVRAKRFYEVGPLPGLGLTKEEIPGNVQSLTAKDIKEAHSLSLTELMNSKLQSVNVNDYQGNPFQMDVTYRGFTAGPQIGTPQGLSAFFDGIRVNEPFGDVVNWDMIPMNALATFDVFPGSNPVFGLGTLGGALSMKTKDGFNNPGVEAEVLTGSFGRRQLQASGGWNNGTVAGFAAANIFLEDGWRTNSPSRVNQVFGKASYRGDKLDLNLSTLVAWNDLVGNGLLPNEMYKQDRNGVFTSPDTTDNRLWQFQLSGSYFVNENFTVTGQVYRRNSKRKSLGGDVYTEFGNQQVKRNLAEGEQFTCLFNSTNQYGLPDYAVIPWQNGDWGTLFDDPALSAFLFAPTIEEAFAALPPSALNAEFTDPAFLARALDNFQRQKNFEQTNIFTPGGEGYPEAPNGETSSYSNGDLSYYFESTTSLSSLSVANDPISTFVIGATSFYYYTPDTVEAGDTTPGDGAGVKHVVVFRPPINGDVCHGDITQPEDQGLRALSIPVPGLRTPQTVDGAVYGTGPGSEGVVDGTPTAVLSNTQIDQVTDGASIQFNWNYPKHKFMIGMSLDAPSASYTSSQMLGMMDAERDVFLAPDQIRDQYAAASQAISNNNFDGSQLTKSIYASETWSPVETLHFTASARYNETRGKNKIASRTFGTFVWDLAQFQAYPNYYDVCVNGECPTTGYITPDASKLLHPAEKEKFSYYSFNPSLGATWQASPNLNVYGNWSQGTRTPSVIELGCAFDKTLIPAGVNPDGTMKYIEKSIGENRSCSLPTTLSGDPYLPQIKATTYDLGMRGTWGDNVEWNLGLYQTDLKDDIYMISFPGNRNFFDTIGKTRRRGLEAGITAAFDKLRIRVNYALTDATFQDTFTMTADDNSSSTLDPYCNDSGACVYDLENTGRRIKVKPGNRMPGVPLHNLNATLSYQVTPKWQVGITAVAHSFAFVRGNENNKHRSGETIYELDNNGQLRARPVSDNPGTTPGYLTLNFQTSYKINSEWTLGLRVNNLLDKEYFTAGRLGRNPFSPSINGAIGPDGYNHNSNDWLMTNFLSPGAPRAAWVSLSYDFDPRK
ncbi:Outer membrane receptor proteins, mostly Fe transport [Methylobacillus rhizosphaerae]|uniref:Outer membrane receptor proteins, mostly Fe transport n=1 Tax=Methylobacillus rhizosphaerae TaxID=551994 RepID=A0A238YZG8_9PROT|nr:TonB-dependent receptor [Methylobacillus rhizosphaerae]SNR76033.1 Outer membrane receptor proteins, mostly Fe transport [Methylobacillus rhizosphaerae]